MAPHSHPREPPGRGQSCEDSGKPRGVTSPVNVAVNASLRRPSGGSVKLAVVDFRLLLTLCVFALGEGAEGELACG